MKRPYLIGNHGTAACYHYGCRCMPCRFANSEYKRDWYHLRSTHKPEIDRVFEAVHSGAATSEEVSEATKLPVKFCAAYLRTLENRGLIRRTGKRIKFRTMTRGNFEWEVIKKARAA